MSKGYEGGLTVLRRLRAGALGAKLSDPTCSFYGMFKHDAELVLSATDLANFLGCRHRTALDMAVAGGTLDKPERNEDPLLTLLAERGLAHEKAYVDWLAGQKLTVVEPSSATNEVLVAETVVAMKKGVDVIVQGGLRLGQWFGKPDILRRVARKSDLGDWSYEVYDTKLSRNTKAGAVLQLGLYSEMVSAIQGQSPERFYIVAPRMLPGKPAPEEMTAAVPCPDSMMVLAFRSSDYSAYLRLVQKQLDETSRLDADAVALANYPDPVSHCQICRWNQRCDDKRHKDDHISLVAGIGRMQRRELEGLGVTTLTKCATTWPLPEEPKRGSLETYENAHKQALLQVRSKKEKKLLYELRPVVSAKAATETEPAQKDEGLCRLPEPSDGDVFLDLEGDPYATEGGREYLIGLVTAEPTAKGEKPKANYQAFWGFNAADECKSFEAVMDFIGERRKKHPGMHVYHYAPYETTAFKKLRLRYETRKDELDAMLSGGVFVDLYAIVRQGVRVGSESYSIKKLEPLYDFKRAVELEEATLCRNAIEVALQSGQDPAADIMEKVRGYNEDDCVSTLWLRNWLEKVRGESKETIPRPTAEVEAERKLNEHEQRVAELRPQLLNGIPEDPAQRDDEQQARWLLAYSLDYHRREALASFWEYYRLRDLPDEELEDEPKAITGLKFVGRLDERITRGKPSGIVTDRYSFPPQEMEIEKKALLNLREGGAFGDVVAVDRLAGTIDVCKRKKHKDYHPVSVFDYKHISSDAQEASLIAIAERVVEDGRVVASNGVADRAGRSLLLALPPRLTKGKLGAPAGDIVEHLTNAVLALDESVLPVQGPPGAGKTYAGAEAIVSLVAAGKKVGIAATGHKVIRKLLDDVAKAAKRRKVSVSLGHKCDEDEAVNGGSTVKEIATNPEARRVLDEGEINVLGGTAWLWSRGDMASSIDVLFVDEAGQMALANVLAMSPAAKSLVLLGDPQQLEQPRRAAHPDGVDVSALEHMLRGHVTVAPEQGVFLPRTWRMTPAITAYTSEMFYEGRLSSIEGLERQVLGGGKLNGLGGAGLRLVFSEHDSNKSYSDEEVIVVSNLVKQLLTKGVIWVDEKGETKAVTAADVLVVAPYNAQVSRLATALKAIGVRAGTVDKFQGQEAAVVIYSMASSSAEDAPRGMEFLYDLHRLNVATSRARCVAIVVANRRLCEPECRTPRQMRLANALCRYRELAPAPEL